MTELSSTPTELTVRGHSAPAKPGTTWARRPSGRGVAPGILIVVAFLLLAFGSPVLVYQGTLIVVYAVAAIGQDWLIGRTGQVSIGAAAFLCIGAFAGAKVSEQSWGYFPLPLIFAAVLGGAVGLVVGVSGLRFRGIYLLLSTLALQFIVAFLGLEYEGSSGALLVPAAHFAGLRFAVGKSFLGLELVVLALTVLALDGLYRRSPGRAWRAISQNEVAAAVASINVVRWKLLAFVGSSAVTAMAGALLAYQSQEVSYQAFSLDLAVSVLVMVFVGGQGSMAGALLGAALVTLLPFGLQNLSQSLSNVQSVSNWLTTKGAILDNAIYGLALLVVLIFERDGLAGLLRRLTRRVLS